MGADATNDGHARSSGGADDRLARPATTGRAEKPPACTDSEAGPSAPASSDWNAKVAAHRHRQASVAAILDQTFGRLAQCSPDLWERRAYLMLVGVVYERLATREEDIPTYELIALAKALAENRRADSKARERRRDTDEEESSSRPTGTLPGAFRDMVRQVYGTNLQTSEGTDPSSTIPGAVG